MIEWNSIWSFLANFTFDMLYVALIIGTIVVILLENRNPVKTIAWVLVLLFLPIVGLVLYAFFGRSQRRERMINRNSYSRLLKRPMAGYLSQDFVEIPADYSRLIALCQQNNQAFPFEGNKVETFTEGRDMLYSLLRDLGRAEKHIHVEFYIFMNDAVGRLVRDMLIDKCKQGVQVRVLYDDVGCWHVEKTFFEEMLGAGIDARAFLKVRFPIFTSKVNYRNHRKIVVIDGMVGYVGGMNIAERYVTGVPWGVWRDTHLKIEGKAVYGLQSSFLLDWYFVDRSMLTDATYFPQIGRKGNSLVQIVTSDPVGPWEEIMQGLLKAISQAKSYFYLQTPYFLPTETILSVMQTAALSGVDIRLMLPEKADNKITHLGSCSYLYEMLRAGVKVYFYQKGFLHSKLMVSDDAFASVGSTNLDFRSFEHNFEVNAFIYDKGIALQMKSIFLRDQRSCVQLQLKKWAARSWTQRMKESVVRLLAPLL